MKSRPEEGGGLLNLGPIGPSKAVHEGRQLLPAHALWYPPRIQVGGCQIAQISRPHDSSREPCASGSGAR